MAASARIQTVAYHPNSVHFGAGNYANRNSAFSGMVDSKTGTVSLWFNLTGGDAAFQDFIYFINSGNTAYVFAVDRSTGNKIRLNAHGASGATAFTWTSINSYTSGGGWVNVLAAWKLDATPSPVLQVYINNVPDSGIGVAINNIALNWTQANATTIIGAEPDGTRSCIGDLAEIWLDPLNYIDLSVAGNRARFINQSKPVSLGATGQLPTGSSPILYLKDAYTSFTTNSGTGGNLSSITGTLSAGAYL